MDDDRNLDLLLDQLALETAPGYWHARPVLDENQWAVFQRLVNYLDDDEHIVLAGCALTAFFDPERHVAALPHDVKKMSVLFAVTQGREKTNVKPLLFIADDESDVTGATDFLRVWGAAVIKYEPLFAPQDFVEKVISTLNSDRNYSGDRRPINPIESKVANHIQSRTQYVCLREVAVHRLIPEGVLALNFELSRSLRSLGPIDVVMHSQDSNNPLLCIEVDGSTHLETQRLVQDGRKNRLLREIGLPVLRILPADISLWQQSWRQEFYLYEKIISGWANSIAKNIDRSLAEDIEDDHFQRDFLRSRNQLSSATYGVNYHDLSMKQRAIIDGSELLSELMVDKHYSDLLKAGPPLLDQSEQPLELTEPPSRLSRYVGKPRIHGSIQSGVQAETVFRLQGASEILKSATFFLSHPYLTEAETHKQLTKLALRHLYWLADWKVSEHRR